MIHENELARRDNFLSAITRATEIFLRGSLGSWQQNVFQVISLLGHELGIRRIILCKNETTSDGKLTTGVRYEWIAAGNKTEVDVPSLQQIDLIEAGFGRWSEVLKRQHVIVSKVSDLPLNERGWFISENGKSIIVVPVFVEQTWWGFIMFEDYASMDQYSEAEVDAFKAISVIFGAAIHRKRTEEALERGRKSIEQKVREIQDIAKFPSEDPSPVIRVSKDGVLLYSNRAADPLLAFWQVRLGDKLPQEWLTTIHEVFSTNKTKAADVVCQKQIFSVLFSPVLESDYVNLYGRDVTLEREVEQLKSDFISIASHQLRTPLTTIRWYADKLQRHSDNLNAEQKEWTGVVYQTSLQVSDLVNGLLNISRVERGKIQVNPEMHSLADVLKACTAEFQEQAQQKQVTIREAYEPILDFPFDDDLIREVQRNVLSNAVKYSPPQGLVDIRTSVKDNMVIVQVTDQGIGIPPEEKDKMFDRFFRASNALQKNIEGTGLGLAFAKMIVEKSGGTIWFDSKLNQGTTFYYSLPITTNVIKEA